MSRTFIATHGVQSWRERLADPEKHWRREYSAFETAVSWELAAGSGSGLPVPIHQLLDSAFGSPELLLGIAEHKVSLPGGNRGSQNDVWGLVQTASGTVSLTIEAKASEPFGNHTLAAWFDDATSDESSANRELRWSYVRKHLPSTAEGAYSGVAYQLLHRCAAAVIEAKRFRLKHAACVIQAFNTPDDRFQEFSTFCTAIGIVVPRGGIAKTSADGIELAIGWADCLLATDEQIAAVA